MVKSVWHPPTVDQLVTPKTTHDEFEQLLKLVIESEQDYLINMCLAEFNSKIWKNIFNPKKVK